MKYCVIERSPQKPSAVLFAMIPLLPLAACLAALCFPSLASSLRAEESASVIIGDKEVGRTPQIIGINTGEMPEGSAFPEWVRAMGVNGARLRLNAAPSKETDGKTDSVADLENRARRLRSSAKQETPKLWTHPSKVAATSLQALREADIELLATITCPYSFLLLKPDGKTNWSQAWRFWEAYYAQAYQLARQHQVRRFQLFNEPNHKESAKLTQEEYSARMAVGCDAIQAALADAGRDGGIKLDPLISAPCTAGISIFTTTGKPEARDEKIGWGELSMRDRRLRIGGKTDRDYAQFQQYAVQHYSANPTSWLEQLEKLSGLIRQSNGGQPMPVIMSEFNIRTARDFSKRPTTMDSPDEFPDVGSMAVAIAESGLEELYFFRLTLSKNFDDGGVKKNGIHHVNESGAIPEITGSARAGEVVRLAAQLLRNGQERVETKVRGAIRVAATRTRGDMRVLLARTNATATPSVQITFPRSVGNSLLTWETVTTTSFGSTRILTNSIAQQNFQVDLPGFSVGLLSVRSVGTTTPSIVPTTASFSTEPGRLRTGGTNGVATLLRFPAQPIRSPVAAFLRLKGCSTALQQVPVHLYRVIGNLPAESTLRSGQLPFLRKLSSTEEPELSVDALGKDLQWVGGFTVEPEAQETCVEITAALGRASDKPLNFLLTRDRRQAGEKLEPEPVEWQGAEILLFSR